MNKAKELLQVMFQNVRKRDDDSIILWSPPSQGFPDGGEDCDQKQRTHPESSIRAEKSCVQVFLFLAHCQDLT